MQFNQSGKKKLGNWIHWVREEKRNAQIDQFWVTKKAINQRTIFLPTWGFLKTLEHLTELQCSAPAEWLFFKTQNERIILRDFGISGGPHAGLDDSWSFAKITSLPSRKFWYTSNFSLLYDDDVLKQQTTKEPKHTWIHVLFSWLCDIFPGWWDQTWGTLQ